MYYKNCSRLRNSEYFYQEGGVNHRRVAYHTMHHAKEEQSWVSCSSGNENLLSLMPSGISLSPLLSSSSYYTCFREYARISNHIADDFFVKYGAGNCAHYSKGESPLRFTTDLSAQMVFYVDVSRVMEDFNEVQHYFMYHTAVYGS